MSQGILLWSIIRSQPLLLLALETITLVLMKKNYLPSLCFFQVFLSFRTWWAFLVRFLRSFSSSMSIWMREISLYYSLVSWRRWMEILILNRAWKRKLSFTLITNGRLIGIKLPMSQKRTTYLISYLSLSRIKYF